MGKRIILYAVYALIIAGLLVAIILAFQSKDSTPTPKQVAQQNQQKAGTPASPKAPKTAPSPKSQPQSPPPAPQPKPKAAPAPAPTPNPSSSRSATPPASLTPTSPKAPAAGSNPQLTNTGPGDVALLFAVTSLTGTAAAYGYQRRKFAR